MGKNGVATVGATVGKEYGKGVSFTTGEVVDKLFPLIEKGYSVIADLHNHPYTGLHRSAGFSFSAVTTPSASDFDSQPYVEVPEQLHIPSYPRVIIAHDKEAETYAINAFYQNRDITTEESVEWSIPDPSFVQEEPDEIGIVMQADSFLDPAQLIRNGVITLLNTRSVLDESSDVIVNCLQEFTRK